MFRFRCQDYFDVFNYIINVLRDWLFECYLGLAQQQLGSWTL